MTNQLVDQQTGYVEIDGKQLYYEMAGEGDTIVFGHAAFLDSGMWDDQWATFAQNYRVIRYDMRGFGKSDPLDAPTSRRAELQQLLAQLGVEKTYLVGCSMGGEMMLDFAIEHPQMVKGLVMINSAPSGFEMQGEPPTDLLTLMDAMQKGNLDLISEMQLRVWIDGPYRQPNQVNSTVRERARQMTLIPVRNSTWAIADMQPADPMTPPALQQLHSLQLPTLIMVGALDDPEIHRAADLLVNEIDGARKVVIEDAAHIPSMEKPAEFNRALLAFLKSVE